MDVLGACNLVSRAGIPVVCDFCGEFGHFDGEFGSVNDQIDHFYKYIYEHNLDTIVRYRGVVIKKDKQTFLKNAHICILPTYYAKEGSTAFYY